MLTPWIEHRCTKLMGQNDEIVISYVTSHMEQEKNDSGFLCPKKMQVYLTGFMEDKTPIFMDELVKLLIEANQSPNGVPISLIREKELELEKKK